MAKGISLVLIAGLLATSGLIGRVYATFGKGDAPPRNISKTAAVDPGMGDLIGTSSTGAVRTDREQTNKYSLSSLSDDLTVKIFTSLPYKNFFQISRISRNHRDVLHAVQDDQIRAVLEGALDYETLTEMNHTILSSEDRNFLENVQNFLNMWFKFEGHEEGFPQRIHTNLATLAPKGKMPFWDIKEVLGHLFQQDDGAIIEVLSKTPDSFLDIFRPVSWMDDPLITDAEAFPTWKPFFEAIAEQRPALFSKFFEKLPTFQSWPEFCALGPTQHRWVQMIGQKNKAHFQPLIEQPPAFQSWEDPTLSYRETLQLIDLIPPMERSHFVHSLFQNLPPLSTWETAFSSPFIPCLLMCVHETDKQMGTSYCLQLLQALPAFQSWEDPALSSHDNIFGLLPLISEADRSLLERLVGRLSPLQSWDNPALSSPVMEKLSEFVFEANSERFLQLFGNLPPLVSWDVALSLYVIPHLLDIMHQINPDNFQRLVRNLPPLQSWADPALSSPHLRDIPMFLDMMREVDRPLFLDLTQHLNTPPETLGHSGSSIRKQIFSIIEAERSKDPS